MVVYAILTGGSVCHINHVVMYAIINSVVLYAVLTSGSVCYINCVVLYAMLTMRFSMPY